MDCDLNRGGCVFVGEPGVCPDGERLVKPAGESLTVRGRGWSWE